MAIEFDKEKNEANIAKHGISLDRTADFVPAIVITDNRRDYGETRYRAFGHIDRAAYCLIFTFRGDDMRPISLRRAHAKEMKRHASQK
jgi:hypothetical protein